MHLDAACFEEQEIGGRCNWAVRLIYPVNTSKELQRRHGLTESQADRLLMGRVSLQTLARLAKQLGAGFALTIHGHTFEAKIAILEERLEANRRELQEMKVAENSGHPGVAIVGNSLGSIRDGLASDGRRGGHEELVQKSPSEIQQTSNRAVVRDGGAA